MNNHSPVANQQAPKKILIIGPAWVGDMIMAQSLFKLLKHRYPQVELDVLASDWTFSLLACMPEVSKAIEMPLTHGELKLRQRYQLAKQLRAAHYDQAIVLQNSFKSALIPWLAKIPKRTGYVGELRYGLLNDIRYRDKKNHSLMVEQFLALGLPPQEKVSAENFYPTFQVTQTAQERVLSKLGLSLSPTPILALGAGAEFGPSKRWPEAYFAEVAKEKLAAGWQVWLFGSGKDAPITEKIMELTQNRCENIAGKLQLEETIALLSLVSGVISNDSGLMHIAAALKKPVIAIYGSTSPAFTPPLAKQANILKLNLSCQPCFKRTCPLGHHRCMKDLTPDYVQHAMKQWGV